jgi:tetratricopeptide (TPR) repeat protein
MQIQPELFEQTFATLSPANPIYCHQEFLEKLEAHRNHPIGKRAGLLMQSLAVNERRQHYKSTQGENRGWRRSRLGGNQGSHFYAWWAPKAAPPIKAGEGFQYAPDGALFLRDIRHHDDHSPARAQSFGDYLPVSVPEMRREEYGPAPWTPSQARFASARHPVRILKGHPGSGKTTALLHAADASGAERVLYLTYSRELAALARQYFDRYCSRDRHFRVVTFETFLRQLLGVQAESPPLGELRRRLRGDLAAYSRSHGAWTDRTAALYDELHAHLAGDALPITIGRFEACQQPRVSDKSYRQRRIRYLGEGAANAALDLANRLERADGRSLAERYFPELALAWRAACAVTGKGSGSLAEEFLDFGCLAVDECQDLTPLESYVLVELAAAAGRRRGRVQVLVAGDEAQTVRPTDFEWGWMNDLLHHRVGTPVEFKLASNLRSPRRIAELVNRVWDLYAEVEKRDRPSGTGYAEIEDDATDQVFYCTAAPGEAFSRLMADLAGREGLAIVSLDPQAREVAPEGVRGHVLTVPEIKGLDFHTVCVVNAGRQLETIVGWRRDFLDHYDIESLRRRLAIDELRVALSRPAERLIWLDINPSPKSVRTTLDFLNRDSQMCPLAPSLPEAVLTGLQEEQLDLEERVQRCLSDARQYLSVKPDLAWSRAQQAVALLGDPANHAAVHDPSVRKTVRMTQAEICFCLAMRKASLAAELGRPDLFQEAAAAALNAGCLGLPSVIRSIGAVHQGPAGQRLVALGDLAQVMARYREELEPWLLVEIESHASSWVQELESGLSIGENAVTLSRILPPFYEALRLPDAESRKQRLWERAIRFLVKNRRHAQALQILQGLSARQPELEAECLEGMGEHARAADVYRSIGKLKEALACYRAVPDFDAAAALIREVGAHPAAESYEWLMKLKAVVGERPANFSRVMQASEKKVLEQMLEQALGVTRKRPAARKTAPRAARTKRGSGKGTRQVT